MSARRASSALKPAAVMTAARRALHGRRGPGTRRDPGDRSSLRVEVVGEQPGVASSSSEIIERERRHLWRSRYGRTRTVLTLSESDRVEVHGGAALGECRTAPGAFLGDHSPRPARQGPQIALQRLVWSRSGPIWAKTDRRAPGHDASAPGRRPADPRRISSKFGVCPVSGTMSGWMITVGRLMLRLRSPRRSVSPRRAQKRTPRRTMRRMMSALKAAVPPLNHWAVESLVVTTE